MLKEPTEQDAVEAMWVESSRKVAERQKREVRATWYSHHLKMHDVHAGLAREHERKAMELLEAADG